MINPALKMEMNVLVSVIVPMYNSQETIVRAISSIQSQSHQCLEIVVVDDGSTDHSIDLVREIDDSRIRILQQANKGASSARNYGMREARGEWICFVDSDDALLPRAVENLVKAAGKETDVVIGCFQQNSFEDCRHPEFAVDVASDQLAQQVIFWQKYTDILRNQVFFQETSTLRLNTGAPWAKLYRTEFLRKKDISFNEKLTLHEDTLFNYKAYKNARSIRILAQVVYCYIENRNSITRSTNPRFIKHALAAMESIVTMEPELPESVLYFCLFRIDDCIEYILTESDSWASRYSLLKRYRNSGIIPALATRLPLQDNPYVDTFHLLGLYLFKHQLNMLLACMPLVKKARKIKNWLTSFCRRKQKS